MPIKYKGKGWHLIGFSNVRASFNPVILKKTNKKMHWIK